MAVITLSRADMLAAIARGESVSLGAAGIITRADQVPSQAALDAGSYDPLPGTGSGVGIAESGGALGTSAPSGAWILPLGTPGTFAMGAGFLQLAPLWVPRAVSISEILGEVTAGVASTFLRMGIYRDTGSGYPGALVAGSDSGQLDASTVALKPFTYAPVISLAPGLYWVGGVNQGGTPTVRNSTGNNSSIAAESQSNAMVSTHFAYFQSGVTGALPSTFTATPVSSTQAHRVALKVA